MNEHNQLAIKALEQMRGAVPAFVLWWLAGITIVGLWWIYWAAHKYEPKLRVECEARGGMLIGTRSELYTCVGKPAAAPSLKGLTIN